MKEEAALKNKSVQRRSFDPIVELSKTNRAECLQTVIHDVLEVNKCNNSLPLFVGSVSSANTFFYLRDIQTIDGESLKKNPYIGGDLLVIITTPKKATKLPIGKKFLFSVKLPDPLKSKSWPLATEHYVSFEEIGVQDSSELQSKLLKGDWTEAPFPTGIRNILLNSSSPEKIVEEKNQDIDTISHIEVEKSQDTDTLSQTVEEKNQDIDALSQIKEIEMEITTLSRRKEEIKQEISALSQKKEKANQEITSLSLKKEKANQEITSLSREKERINQDITSLSQKKKKMEKEISSLSQTKEETEKERAHAQEVIAQAEGLQEVVEHLKQKQQVAEQAITRAKVLSEYFEPNANQPGPHVPINYDTEKKAYQAFKDRLDHKYPDDLLVPFVMALNTTQIITLFGRPGTGKTTFVSKAAKALGAKCSIISVQNSWTDSSDLLGYYNPINGTFQSSAFIDALLEAKHEWIERANEARLHLICLDEMNLARVEYYFAEFLSLLQLQQCDRWIRLLPKHVQEEVFALLPEGVTEAEAEERKRAILESNDSKAKELLRLSRYIDFRLPPNVRFIGTINNDDTTNSLSPKVIDRSFFLEMTGVAYSTCKDLPEPEDYIPVRFFQHKPADKDFPVFANENKRFMNYVKWMWPMYRCILPRGSEDTFCEYIILSKVLPALRQADDYTYNRDDFPRAFKEFSSHRNETNAYNYLGG